MTQGWVEKQWRARLLTLVAHAGYAGRGVVYLLIGGLALMAAFGGSSGQTTGAHGTEQRVLSNFITN